MKSNIKIGPRWLEHLPYQVILDRKRSYILSAGVQHRHRDGEPHGEVFFSCAAFSAEVFARFFHAPPIARHEGIGWLDADTQGRQLFAVLRNLVALCKCFEDHLQCEFS